MAGAPILSIIEPGATLFRAAEIRVVVLSVGNVPEPILREYYDLVTRYRRVELALLQSFYKAHQKSPFKYLPWKAGAMHFRFLSEEAARAPNPLTKLLSHRKILGVIGVVHCPAVQDLAHAYARFEQLRRMFPDALTARCFAFEPSDIQAEQGMSDKELLMMFPPTQSGGVERLENYAEVVMLDFAASMLGALEAWMLTASPAMIDLATFADTSDRFLGPPRVVDEVQKRLYTDEEMMRKRRYGRLQKAMGDVALLAGSPRDAISLYSAAIDLARIGSDHVWAGAALGGMASAKVMDACVAEGLLRRAPGGGGFSPGGSPERGAAAVPPIAEGAPPGGRGSLGWGGTPFWAALGRDAALEADVRGLLGAAKAALRRRGALPLQAWLQPSGTSSQG